MTITSVQRPTNAQIDLNSLVFNFHSVKNFVGQNLKYMAVIKADAYGHGAVPCSRRLESEGIDWFGVALPEEGLELRKKGIKKPILCLNGFWVGQENLLLENNLTPVIYQIDKALSFSQAAKKKGLAAKAHIKIDTGMGRIGVRFDEVESFVSALAELKNIEVEGLMTHFAAADDLSEINFTSLQIQRFNEAALIFEHSGFTPIYKDLANSPGAVVHPASRKNMVRIGGILYGLGGDVLPEKAKKPELKPVMSVHTKIAHLKTVPKGETIGYGRTFKTQTDSVIGTIPIGYHDGFPRALSNQGQVLINGQFAPIAGRISMDWTLIDVTHISNVKIDDEVVIIGTQGDLRITAEDLARQTGTISYEITCGISQRVPRIYVGG